MRHKAASNQQQQRVCVRAAPETKPALVLFHQLLTLKWCGTYSVVVAGEDEHLYADEEVLRSPDQVQLVAGLGHDLLVRDDSHVDQDRDDNRLPE